ncbi:Carboxylic ester hydrolase [Mycena kentingensis (nom. inval.)]|nr:Carboxylic ester hydrolase [Mycena kentingensis (nom. inval.)]
MRLEVVHVLCVCSLIAARAFGLVDTTSGILCGDESGGVISFKGIPFAQPPIGPLRWKPPVPFAPPSPNAHNNIFNATTLGPACISQFPFANAELDKKLFNTPAVPPEEAEDCLFLNVWEPALGLKNSGRKLPVIVWFFGGGLAFGTASLPMYGASLAKNQGIVFVSFNYRTNVFGFFFPGSARRSSLDW